jgi:signal transduction histidine kinase
VSFTNRYRAHDGTYRRLLWAAHSDEAEQLIYASARDITSEYEATEQQRALNVELGRQAARLEATNRELEAFSYSVSHDLRAPLRAIDGFSRVIEEEAGDRLPAEAADALQRVQAAARRMGGLIDDLLNLSRVTRSELRHEPVDLTALAGSVVQDLRARDPHRTVSVSIAPGLQATGDARMLRIVLDNLIGNAWKYTSRTPRACVSVTAEPEGGGLAFIVRDNGVGFDMQYAGKLFGAFQRLHSPAEFEGTGIGLALVQRIVTKHGGRISAEAEPGRGATFRFTLAPPQENA